MTTHAGHMQTGSPANPQWVPCDGKPYYVLDPKQSFRGTAADTPLAKGWRNDYVRNVGWQGRRRGLGPIGWIVCVPYDPGTGYKIALATDGSETALTPNITTTTTASVAAGLTVIPVTSAAGMAAGMPIATVGIPAGASIVSIASLNVTISAAVLAGGVANGATVTVTPPGPPTPGKPPAGVK